MEFPAALTSLRAEVEARYGKPLRLVTAAGWPPSRVAEAWVDHDGTPVITINASVPPTEGLLAHELLHLKLRSEGFPVLTYEGEASLLESLPLIQMDRFVYDSIEHYIFEKQMKKYGYDLSEVKTTNLKALLARGDLEGPKPPERLIALYFSHALELGSGHELVVQARRWFERKGWSRELQIARELVELVTARRPSTPKEAVQLFVTCLNRVFGKRARFAVKEWTTGTKGTHRYAEVVISVDGPS